jgi:hypothetical protein
MNPHFRHLIEATAGLSPRRLSAAFGPRVRLSVLTGRRGWSPLADLRDAASPWPVNNLATRLPVTIRRTPSCPAPAAPRRVSRPRPGEYGE